jgi:uncharacterized protein
MPKFVARLLLALSALLGVAASAASAAPDPKPKVLVFSHSTGFRHTSIEPGVAALQAMGKRRGFDVVASADPAVFSPEGLRGVKAIVLLSTTTKPDDPASEWFVGPRRDALQSFVRRGGGIVGIHAAADSHYHWPWYGRMIGGWFRSHPKGTPSGVVTLAEPRHPSARGLASPERRTDEWYYFEDHDPTARLIATLDPASIGEKQVNPKPMAWAHEFEGGRVFYTAMGHTAESFAEPWFVKHLEGGIDWVLRR